MPDGTTRFRGREMLQSELPERNAFPQSLACLVWGGGGHGKVVADLIYALGHQLVGFIDADPGKLGETVEPCGACVVLTEHEFLASHARHGSLPPGVDRVVLAIGDNRARHAALGHARAFMPVLIHPSCTVSASARIGAGTVVFPHAVINAAARIADGVIVNTGAIIEHDCRVAAAVHISPGAVVAGGVTVGERTWIGANATVIQGIRIGSDAIVGAGAVVIRDVPDAVTVAGVPARVVRGG
ncbi:MAG: acetyltransferase [Longimicrobiales bacterium]